MGNFNLLPYEITIEILSRVPAESILECKCVSKPWRNIIQHQSFTQKHLNHLIDSGKSSCIFYSRERGLIEFYYSEYDENCHESPFNRNSRMDLNPPFEDYSLVGSCNGLVCFNVVSSRIDAGYVIHYGPVYICNPVTREYIMLPGSKQWYGWTGNRYRCKGCYRWTGFGYSHSTDEYKAVRICNSEDSNVGIVEVYTLGSGYGWRNAGTMNINMKHVTKGVGAFANGTLYWVKKEGTITVLAFDLADEKCSKLPPPCLTRAGVRYLGIRLGVLGEFLSATCSYDTGDCDIWLLVKNEDNCNDFSWRKEFSFDCRIPQSFGCTKSGRLLCCENRKIYSYNPKASSAKIDVGFGKSIYQAIPHKNTLVSLKVLGEKDTTGERASSSEKTENWDKLKKPQNEIIDRVVGFCAMGVQKFMVAIQKLHLPKCC